MLRGFEGQGWRKGPVREEVGDLLGVGEEALDASSEVDDELSVRSEEIVPFFVVAGVDQWGRAAIWGGWAMVGILGKDLFDAEGCAAYFLICGEGGVVDLADDAPVVGLALVVGHVEQARQGRELDVVGGGEFAGGGDRCQRFAIA